MFKEEWKSDKIIALCSNILWSQLSDWRTEKIESEYKNSAAESGFNPGAYMQLLRILITGISSGPALFETFEAIGKEEVIKRLEAALQSVQVNG